MLQQLTLDEFILKGRYEHAHLGRDKKAAEDDALFNRLGDLLEVLDPPYNVPAVLRFSGTSMRSKSSNQKYWQRVMDHSWRKSTSSQDSTEHHHGKHRCSRVSCATSMKDGGAKNPPAAKNFLASKKTERFIAVPIYKSSIP